MTHFLLKAVFIGVALPACHIPPQKPHLLANVIKWHREKMDTLRTHVGTDIQTLFSQKNHAFIV